MNKKNITFSDIAEYTHFSKTTISRYFNNPDSLTLENQQIIADALEALDYKENKVARILANGKIEFTDIADTCNVKPEYRVQCVVQTEWD